MRTGPATLAAFAMLAAAFGETERNPFVVPDGFTVTKFAGDDLCHDAWAMTIDNDGRVAVSGRGYIKILSDTDRDGVADESHLVSSGAKNAHGLLFDGGTLFSVQPHGIFRHRDTNGDGLADAKPELFYKLPGGGGEHGPHGIRKGPDNWFYVAAGNNTKISEEHVTLPSSPVKKPEQGTILRISPDGKHSEVIAHGFRNHYDLAFNKHGHLFTYDSDGERDHQLPWYSYTRVYHVRVGGHHGWLLPGHQRSFNRPPYFFDSVERLIDIDRGSPTGVEVYRHTQFPEKYRDGLFFACWTYGRVYFTPLIPHGDTYKSLDPETFLETSGNLGFAPVDLAVHPPTGDLFVAVGGRGTRGAIYRIAWTKGRQNAKPLPPFEVAGNWNIHSQSIEEVDPLQPEEAVAQMEAANRTGLPSQSQLFMGGLRSLMLHLGDISTSEARTRIDAGYTAKKPNTLDPTLRAGIIEFLTRAFPTKSQHLDYEVARLLGMLKCDSSKAIDRISTLFTSESHPTDDAHYLLCLAQMPGPRSASARKQIAGAFLDIDRKIASRNLLTDRYWNANIGEALKAHLTLDPGLANAIAAHPDLGHPSHSYLLGHLTQDTQTKASRSMLGHRDGWSADALAFVQKRLPAKELLSLFRVLWEHPHLRPSLSSFLSTQGNDNDKKLVADFYRPPAANLDLAPFRERLAKVDWSTGDPQRGQAAYVRFNCTACHTGNTRLGPSLAGIAKRLSRDDLFRHINEPNLAVSDLYKATQITTKDGEIYVGVPVYRSESQTILETGTGETIRFSRHDIVSERQPNQSPMPPGLLLPASSQDLADLYAYLKTL